VEIFLAVVLIGLVLIFFVSPIVRGFKEGANGGKKAIDTSHLPEQFVVFDLETTGLDADKHEIIEIAAIKYTRGQTSQQTFQCLIKPSKHLPKKIIEITGITDEILEKEGGELRVSLDEFAAFVGGLRLVTFNAEFDMAFLQQAATTCDLPQFNNPVSCALKMSRRAWPKRKSYRLVDLSKDGQIDEGKAHRALEDARRALIIYSAAVAQLKSVA
jgi:DNA polymerase III subunit epsilon